MWLAKETGRRRLGGLRGAGAAGAAVRRHGRRGAYCRDRLVWLLTVALSGAGRRRMLCTMLCTKMLLARDAFETARDACGERDGLMLCGHAERGAD